MAGIWDCVQSVCSSCFIQRIVEILFMIVVQDCSSDLVQNSSSGFVYDCNS